MPRPATILHTADVHLAAGTGGREERAFERAVDAAIDRDVDAVVIAGDLFDHARVADDLLEGTAAQLNRLERPVVLLTGNHDVLDETSVHHRFRVTERCANVVLLDDLAGSTVEVDGTDIVVWGKAMAEHVPAFRPIAGVPDRPDGRWSVVAAHGLYFARAVDPHRASPIRRDELDAVDWDYVALGHCHRFEEVRTGASPVIYPGATAASQGSAAGAVVVDFVPGRGARPQWIEL
jgi:DNA repair exonuclease SbcCD nuclease subunit